MKLNGFQSKNVEEDKIVPQLKEAAKRFNIDIAPETPLERIKVSPNRKSYFFGAGHTYCCCGYESSDRKSYLVLIWAQAMPAASKNQPRSSNRWKTKFV